MYPYSNDERENSDAEAALNRMVEDRLYWREQDPEFRDYVDASFKSVFGNEPAEQDATGRTVAPAPRAAALPPFRPSVTPEDTALSGPVGDAEPNAWRDVLKVQKGLAKTDHYAFDMAKERSGEHSPALAQAIRNFQREKREEIDGLLLPGGPTITRMKETLFGDNAGQAFQSPVSSTKGPASILTKGLTNSTQSNLLGAKLNALPSAGTAEPHFVEVRYAGKRPHQNLPTRPGAPDEGIGPMPVQQSGPAPSDHRRGPRLYKGDDRQRSIIENTPGHIVVAENPNARSKEPWYAKHTAGQDAVKKFDKIIEREAARFGVDPDLVRAIMYVENSHGYYGGGAEIAETLGVASSLFPMNIRPNPWKGLGFTEKDFKDPELNIRAGVVLLRRIQDRVQEPTIRKIATLYWSLPQDRVFDYGARVEEVHRTKAWTERRPSPHVPHSKYAHPVETPPMP